MAVNTWSSAGSTDGNAGANWSLGALNATDTLTWDATSVVNCTFTGAISCTAIDCKATYTGTLNDGGQTFTISGAVTIAAGGAVTCSGTWTQTGDANFSFNCTGAGTCAGWRIVVQGTGSFEIKKTISASMATKITCANATKTTTITANHTAFACTANVTLGTGTLTMNGGMRIQGTTPFTTSGSMPTINGAQYFEVYSPAAGGTVTIAALTLTGTVQLYLNNSTANACTFNLNGALTTAGTVDIYSTGAGTTIFNTNNNVLTCTSLRIGPYGVSSNITYNFGSSAVTLSLNAANAYLGTTYNAAGTCTINFQTSTWTCSGTWTHGSNHTVNVGSFQVTFTGVGTLTLNGKSMYDVVVNSVGVTRTVTDSLTCNSLSKVLGTLTFSAGANLTVSGVAGVTLAGSANCTFQNITFSANGALFTQNCSGTVSAQTVTFSDNGNMVIGFNTTFNRMIFTDGKNYNQTGAGILTVTTNTAGDLSGSLGSYVKWYGSGKVKLPAGVVVLYMWVINIDNSTGTAVDATHPSNNDGGGNVNWIFSRSRAASRRRRSFFHSIPV